MSCDHLPPVREEPDEVEKLSVDQVEAKSYVGVLVKAFEQKVAESRSMGFFVPEICGEGVSGLSRKTFLIFNSG